MTQGRCGTGHGRCAVSSSVDACRTGTSNSSRKLEIAAECLLALDRLEERFEVSFAEAARAVALDHLEEERRPVLRRLREDLQQVALLVAVGEDPQPLEIVPVLADLTDAGLGVEVIRIRSREEVDALVLERLDCAHDVVTEECDVLHARAAEVLEVLVDLALALALGGLVDRKLDLSLPVGH